MRRMMIQADDELLDRARHRAAERGVSIAQIVREALERELGAQGSQPELRSIGAFRSGGKRADAYEPPRFRS